MCISMQNGLTAVMIAAEWGSSLIMKQLIVEHNANLNLQNNVRLVVDSMQASMHA